MALPHIGYDELIKVKTEKLTVIIKGPEHHPKLETREMSGQKTDIVVKCQEKYDVRVYHNIGTKDIEPLFFEQQEYQILIQFNKNLDVEFWHENKSIREKITGVDLDDEDSKKAMLSGNINWRGNIGFSDLVVRIDGEDYLTITLEVFPIKLDYKEDYKAIIDDLTSDMYNLIFEFLRETYRNYDLGLEHANSLVEFLEILKHIYSDYIKSIDTIIARPYHVLITTHEVTLPHKAKRIDNQTIKWLERHGQYVKRTGEKYNVSKILAAKKEITYDTKENQLAKFILISTIQRLNEFKRNYLAMDRVKKKGPDQEIIMMLDNMISNMNKRLNNTFLKNISKYNGTNQLSLVFQMAPGYRDLYKYYLMLQHGLSLSGDVFHMSLKDLSDLYEYWCFVKLNHILQKKYVLEKKEKVKTNSGGLFVTLIKDKSKSKVEYTNSKGEKITLSYNPSGKYPTGPQKPDNVLSLEKKGTNIQYEYVFDAKYKMNPAQKDTYYYNHISKTPGPEEEDINTMHRYRDAIVSKHTELTPHERLMFGAYVLFPLSSMKGTIEEYKEHIFYKSIEEVNIGGLPFLPSTTELVEELLEKLIEEPANEAFEHATFPKGSHEMVQFYRQFAGLSLNDKKDILDLMIPDMDSEIQSI